MRIEPLGSHKPFAQLHYQPVAGRIQLRDANLRGSFVKLVPRSFEPPAIVEELRAFEHFDSVLQTGAPSRHGMQMVRRLAVRPEPNPARLQKRRPFLAPGIVCGRLLHRQSLRGG